MSFSGYSTGIVAALLGVSSTAAPAPAGPTPAIHLQVEVSADGLRLRGHAAPDAAELAHRHTGALFTSPAGGAALTFAGHPEQAVVLGSLPAQAPVTVALWLRRNARSTAHPAGATHPEYSQEHALGQGRLLSPLTGHPRDAARLSGILRLGPEGLQVWHGPDRWSVVVPGPLPAEEWIHLAVVFAADGTATGYRDGRRAGATRSGFHFGTGPAGLAAAALDRGYGFPFAGALADFRLVPAALSPEAIAQLARTSRSNPDRPHP
jgi:hypothetical protein